MACVEGILGKKIEALMEESNELWESKEYKESINKLVQAWELLPNDKNQYEESYHIVWGILDISILIHDIETMNKWVDKILYADPERFDDGEKEMWVGKVAFESGDFEKAKEYFRIASKKSGGRCFREERKEYYELLLENND
jgi:tetratricopeptide (TPR) repeat protein